MVAVYCSDVGSIARGNFGWARLCEDQFDFGTDIAEQVRAIADDLRAGRHVALGFECPLFVPITADPRGLTAARPGEGDRPWSAGAGAGSLATGLTESAWLLHNLRAQLSGQPIVTLNWHEFASASGPALFLWEAFVTKDAKADTHHGDAELAVRAFRSALPDPTTQNAVECSCPVRSLIGGAALFARLVTDLAWLSTPCLVLRVKPVS